MHLIRLHGPWLAVWAPEMHVPVTLPGTLPVTLPGSLRAPDISQRWAAPESCGSGGKLAADPNAASAIGGQVLLQRKFNRPTGLGAEQRCSVGCWVDAVVEQVRLNDQSLVLDEHAAGSFPAGPGDARCVAFRFSPGDLQPFNVLTLQLRWRLEPVVQIHQVALGLDE